MEFKDYKSDSLMPYLLVGENRHNYTILEWLYIINTVNCRVIGKQWPNTTTEVILQPKQFSCFNPGKSREFLEQLANGIGTHADLSILGDAKLLVEAVGYLGTGELEHTDHYVAKWFYDSAPPDHWCFDMHVVAEAGEHIFMSSR